MTEVIEPLGEHEVVVLLLQVCLLLATARGLGLLAQRMDLPSVVGELLAGVVLGPSLLGTISPSTFAALVPQEAAQFHLLEVVSLLGVLMLLVMTGMETDLELIASKGRNAAAISLFGIAVPFGTGVLMGQFLPEQFIADPSQRLVFSLFLGTAMGISAIPVIAKVLIEMNVVRRDIGQVTLAAGMIDDTIGWILLSLVAGMARGGGVDLGSVGSSLVSVVLVVGFAFTLGRRLVHRLYRRIDVIGGGDTLRITVLMVLVFGYGALTHHLGIEAVLGAFLVGIVVGQLRQFGQQARHVFETVTLGVFAPIFFAASGLRVDLTAMADPTVLGIGMLVLAVAIAGKFVGAAMGGAISGLGRWESLSLGAGMNARGAIEIIVATVGLSLGILTQEMYTIVLMVAIVTSLMAPPILRATLKRVPMSPEEEERLARDEQREASFLGNVHRVLLPTRGGANSLTAAALLSAVVGTEESDGVEVTTMAVLPPRDASGEEAERARREAEVSLEAVEEILATVPSVERRRLLQPRVAEVHDSILAEARKGYDLVVLGASEPDPTWQPDGNGLFGGGIVDRIMQECAAPILLLRTPLDHDPRTTATRFRRILLPTTGTTAGRHATELAAVLARHHHAEVVALHVVSGAVTTPSRPGSGRTIAHDLVDGTIDLLADFRVDRAEPLVTEDAHTDAAILRVAEELDIDLIVLSASRRAVSQRAFLGHHTEAVLRTARCPVVVVT